MKIVCVGPFFRIFAITMVHGYIFRWGKTRRIPDPFSPSVKSLRFLRSVACTVSTNVTPPETGTLLMAQQILRGSAPSMMGSKTSKHPRHNITEC